MLGAQIDSIDHKGVHFDNFIIVQHFCIEAWALGNKKIFCHNPKNLILRRLIEHFDVLKNDPEDLPAMEKLVLNRAQVALNYLSLLLRERGPSSLSYNKSSPSAITGASFFAEIRKRFDEGQHIRSFERFLEAFS